MSLLDRIRKEASAPTVKVPPRNDSLAPKGQEAGSGSGVSDPVGHEKMVALPQPAQWSQDPQLLSLEAELARYPVVSAKKVGVRLEEPILEEIQTLCRTNDITVETLLESFFTTCKDKDALMLQIIQEAQLRIHRRTKAGTIRSILTKSKNIR
jgi:hypothetical protein